MIHQTNDTHLISAKVNTSDSLRRGQLFLRLLLLAVKTENLPSSLKPFAKRNVRIDKHPSQFSLSFANADDPNKSRDLQTANARVIINRKITSDINNRVARE